MGTLSDLVSRHVDLLEEGVVVAMAAMAGPEIVLAPTS